MDVVARQCQWNLDPSSSSPLTDSVVGPLATTKEEALSKDEAVVNHGILYVQELHQESDTMASMTASELASNLSPWFSDNDTQSRLRRTPPSSDAVDADTVTGL